MDPLSRDAVVANSTSFYRGFYDAQQRRPTKNVEPTVAQAVGGALIASLPLAALYYFLRRRSAVAMGGAAASAKPSGFVAGIMEAAQKQMHPLGSKNFRVDVTGTKFEDVIGIPEALEEVKQYVKFLQTPERFTRLGARLPKGCMLTGQPGTGKTLLAKAVAGEAGVPFFSCSGADFIEVYAGSGPKRVRELFEAAKKAAPSVVFLDEVDAVGARGNGAGDGGISSEENRTVNQLLAELDGLRAGEAVVVFAATNFVDNIDKALLREGRFDRKIEVPMPDRQAREDLFKHYLKGVVASNVESKAQRLAGLTPGVSPAAISTIVNEAALAAAVRGDGEVTDQTLLPAVDDVLVGKKHRSRMSGAALRRVALHESGHTLVAWLLPQQTDVVKVSITPRGQAAGFTQQLGRETLDMPTDLSLFTDLCVLLGGRLAETTRYNELTTGAQDDYQRATQTAMRQFLAFGMSHRVGLLAYEPQRLDEGRIYQRHSERAQAMAEVEAARLVDAAQHFTRSLIADHEKALHQVADALLDRRELLFEDLVVIMGKPRTVRLTQEAEEVLAEFVKKAEEHQRPLDNGILWRVRKFAMNVFGADQSTKLRGEAVSSVNMNERFLLRRSSHGCIYRVFCEERNEWLVLKEEVEVLEEENVVRAVEAVRRLRSQFLLQHYSVRAGGDGTVTTVMELMDCTLRDVLGAKGRRLTEAQVRAIALFALRGLADLHEGAEMVHGDLSAANIFFRRTGEMRLGDFSSSLPIGCTVGYFGGTVLYTPLEVLKDRQLSSRPGSDIWALGVVLYQCVSGEPHPFVSVGTSDFWSFLQHLSEAREANRPLRPQAGVSNELSELLSGMLSWDPALRPTAGALLSHSYVSEMTVTAAREVLCPLVSAHRGL